MLEWQFVVCIYLRACQAPKLTEKWGENSTKLPRSNAFQWPYQRIIDQERGKSTPLPPFAGNTAKSNSLCVVLVTNCAHTSIFVLCHFTDIPAPVRVRAEATADNTSIRVLWEWSRQGLLMYVDSVRVDYLPEGGSLMMYTVDSTTATSATLSNLQCNTQYTISVFARAGSTGKRSLTMVVSLPARGTYIC